MACGDNYLTLLLRSRSNLVSTSTTYFNSGTLFERCNLRVDRVSTLQDSTTISNINYIGVGVSISSILSRRGDRVVISSSGPMSNVMHVIGLVLVCAMGNGRQGKYTPYPDTMFWCAIIIRLWSTFFLPSSVVTLVVILSLTTNQSDGGQKKLSPTRLRLRYLGGIPRGVEPNFNNNSTWQ